MIRRSMNPQQFFDHLRTRHLTRRRGVGFRVPRPDTQALISHLSQPGMFRVRSVPRVAVSPEKKAGQNWQTVAPEVLLGHLQRTHLSRSLLSQRAAVAAYDIEVAHLQGIALDFMVERMVAGVLQSDAEILATPHDPQAGCHIAPDRVRKSLIKNLRFVQLLGCYFRTNWGKIWDRLEHRVPGCSQQQVDLDLDCPEHLWTGRDWAVGKD